MPGYSGRGRWEAASCSCGEVRGHPSVEQRHARCCIAIRSGLLVFF